MDCRLRRRTQQPPPPPLIPNLPYRVRQGVFKTEFPSGRERVKKKNVPSPLLKKIVFNSSRVKLQEAMRRDPPGLKNPHTACTYAAAGVGLNKIASRVPLSSTALVFHAHQQKGGGYVKVVCEGRRENVILLPE
jgi:hypothetical protein